MWALRVGITSPGSCLPLRAAFHKDRPLFWFQGSGEPGGERRSQQPQCSFVQQGAVCAYQPAGCKSVLGDLTWYRTSGPSEFLWMPACRFDCQKHLSQVAAAGSSWRKLVVWKKGSYPTGAIKRKAGLPSAWVAKESHRGGTGGSPSNLLESEALNAMKKQPLLFWFFYSFNRNL